MNNNSEDERKLGEFLYERWKYEDETLAQRTDWFLVFHAILLEAFFAAPADGRRLLVAVFGVLTAFCWAWIGVRHRWDHQHLAQVIQDDDLVGKAHGKAIRGIADVRNSQRAWMKYARATPTFAIFIPVITTAVWICCLGTVADHTVDILGRITCSQVRWTAGLTALAIATSILMIRLLGNRPDLSDSKFVTPLKLPATSKGADRENDSTNGGQS